MNPLRIGTAVLADLGCVVAFAAVGRVSHGEDLGPVGLLGTAWPFAVGALAGWALAAAPPRKALVATGRRTGVVVWATTVLVGMGLRLLTGAGVQLSFVVVTAIVLGLLVLGWRLVLALIIGARRRAPVA